MGSLGLRLQLAAALTLVAAGIGCGVSPSGAASSLATAESGDDKRAIDGIDWYFQCPQEAPIPVDPARPNHLVFEGEGPFNAVRERLVGTPVTVHGKICEPMRMLRDVVLIIDVSLSMIGYPGDDQPPSDPVVDGTCGRLNAFNAVMDSIDWSLANVGVMTFAASVASDSGLITSKDALIAKITTNGAHPLSEVLCAGLGSTSYVSAFQRAKSDFLSGRKYATKEIFFITDGQPDDATGLPVANDLKNNGVVIGGQTRKATIATVMLKGNAAANTTLQAYASLDSDGHPLHRAAANASELAALLADLAGHNAIDGSRIRHAGTGVNPPTEINVMPYVQDLKFTLPAFTLNIDNRQASYDVNFEYWDKHTNTFTFDGRLKWTDK